MDHIVKPSNKNLLFQTYFRNKLQGELQNSVWNIAELFKRDFIHSYLTLGKHVEQKLKKRKLVIMGNVTFHKHQLL